MKELMVGLSRSALLRTSSASPTGEILPRMISGARALIVFSIALNVAFHPYYDFGPPPSRSKEFNDEGPHLRELGARAREVRDRG